MWKIYQKYTKSEDKMIFSNISVDMDCIFPSKNTCINTNNHNANEMKKKTDFSYTHRK